MKTTQGIEKKVENLGKEYRKRDLLNPIYSCGQDKDIFSQLPAFLSDYKTLPDHLHNWRDRENMEGKNGPLKKINMKIAQNES